jgi:hypothetical protein
MKKSKLLSFRTTDENMDYLEKVAKADDRSVSWVLSKMIDYFRDNNPSSTLKKIRK